MGQTVQQATIELMRRTGMTTVFGNPGSTELAMFRDWPDDFRYVLALQESVVVSMADGYAQATGRPALVNLHSAAGTGHALGAIFTAHKNNTPLVITAGQQARSLLLKDPYLGAQSPAEFPKPYVKWALEPARAEDVPMALARAYDIAQASPKGPVFVSIPVDDWDMECARTSWREVQASPVPDPGTIKQFADRISAAKQVVIVAGPEIDRSGAWNDLVRLAEKIDAAVWTSPMASRGCFPESHPNFAGFLPANAKAISSRLSGADLIFVAGAPAFTLHTQTGGESWPDADILQLTADPGVASYTQSGECVVGDVKAGIKGLVKRLPQKSSNSAKGRGSAPTLKPDDPLQDAYVLQRLSNLRPKTSLIVEEAPSSRPDIQRFLPVDRPESFFATASGGLGFALPAAVGVSLACPEKRVIALVGDGSSMYSIQALWTAAKFKCPLSIIILDNQGYYALKRLASEFGLDAIGSDVEGLDFKALSKGFGVPARSVSTPEELETGLKWVFSGKRPALLHVRIKGR